MEKTFILTLKSKAFRGTGNRWVKSYITTQEIKSSDEKIESDIAWFKSVSKFQEIVSWEEKK